jgi:hypothetical protein
MIETLLIDLIVSDFDGVSPESCCSTDKTSTPHLLTTASGKAAGAGAICRSSVRDLASWTRISALNESG